MNIGFNRSVRQNEYFSEDYNLLWAKTRLNISEDEIVEERNLEDSKGTADGSMLREFY